MKSLNDSVHDELIASQYGGIIDSTWTAIGDGTDLTLIGSVRVRLTTEPSPNSFRDAVLDDVMELVGDEIDHET